MNIAIGCDHRGVHLKDRITKHLQDAGHTVTDCGTDSESSCDYPDYAEKVGELVSNGSSERGILVCGTGVGMAIAANKIKGVRAANAHDDVTAELSRRHNDANILCLSADLLGERLVDHIVEIWMKTAFEGGRHQRRLDKIKDMENRHC